jgi:hypothetical protein
VSFKLVADVLGHHSLNPEIYAADLDSLSHVAAWPEVDNDHYRIACPCRRYGTA